MPSITTNVIRYCVSLTANVKRGGTKKKSNSSTLATAAAIDGPGPMRGYDQGHTGKKDHHDVGIGELCECAPQPKSAQTRDDDGRFDVFAAAGCRGCHDESARCCRLRPRRRRRKHRCRRFGSIVDRRSFAEPLPPTRLRRFAGNDFGDISRPREVEQHVGHILADQRLRLGAERSASRRLRAVCSRHCRMPAFGTCIDGDCKPLGVQRNRQPFGRTNDASVRGARADTNQEPIAREPRRSGRAPAAQISTSCCTRLAA